MYQIKYLLFGSNIEDNLQQRIVIQLVEHNKQ
jgi:hypothetical protein